MGFEPGGRADKLGNRYEGRWVAKQLLRLLNEEIRSVTLEAIGDDEKGIDLWIELKSGRREAHQCKARNGSKEYWSISDLKNRDILDFLRFQLDNNQNCEFVLVSGVPAKLLSDICDSARNSNFNSEGFYRYQIKEVSQARLELFLQFCKALSINADSPVERAKAYDYLRRIRIELYSDDLNAWRDLQTLSGFLLTGEPKTIVATLLTYAESNDRFGNPIYADELRRYLVTQNIHPKNLALETRITPTIERLRLEFEESISQGLIDSKLIHREETDECLKELKNKGVVILHGTAGSGKSGVLYELTHKLQSENILWLPLRLDRRIPRHTAAHFGQEMGLPDSPINCLVAMAGMRSCVLILDQLDAIRWTSTHSASALDVCKELVFQVMSLQREGKLVSIVLSCRTFDLEHDPEIRNWLDEKNERNRAKIEIQPLPESTVIGIVGTAFHKMTGRQRAILSNPQNLSIWVELRNLKNPPSFRSSAELMRQFWKSRRSQLEDSGIPMSDVNTVLRKLVDWLEKKGKITAPVRTISICSTKAVNALKSYGIIQEQNAQISFCHQSYLDFLIAEHLLDEIDNGGSILDWLGSREMQTLFRREQLRQGLALLREESSKKFLKLVKEILKSGNIRFHLKHLVLEVLGQIETIPEEIADYLLKLLSDDYWSQHIFETVILGHVPYVQLLIGRRIIASWLNGINEKRRDRALGLLQSVAEKIPDQVSEQLKPFTKKGKEWLNRVLNTICWRIEYDSEAMFDIRLELARNGIVSDNVDWKSLCAGYPIRALRLIEAVLSIWDISKKEDSPSYKRETLFGNWYRNALEELSRAAESYPENTWKMFMPHIERLTSFKASLYDTRLQQWEKKHIDRYSSPYIGIKRGVVELSIIAGKKLAAEKPEILYKWTKPLENSLSPIIQEILIEVYAHLPAEYADSGIRWLLKDLNRFGMGTGEGEPEWMSAVRLIKALSPHCSRDLFMKLEHSIIHYHAPNEKRLAKYYLGKRKQGYFGHYWGKTQYFLLPALSQNRIKRLTADLISVLNRLFGRYSKEYFLRMGPMKGGLIGSKLDENLEKISDYAWLKIIGNKDIPEEGRGNWEQVSAGKAVESSIWQFSRSLGSIARRFPERFGQLALHFPEDTHHLYISAILDAMVQTKPDSEIPDGKKTFWKPAAIDTVLAVWERFCEMNDREVAMSFCRLIRARASEAWPDSIIEKLLYFASSHPDLEPGKLFVHCDVSAEEASAGILFQNTINCVRGVAAEAIGELLWHHPDLLDKLKPGIESLITDQHPVVRMAAITTILPIINIDRARAVDWFCELSKEDARVLTSHYAVHFLNHTIHEFPAQLTPMISGMVRSSLAEVSQQGAETATAYFLFYGLFKEEVESCRVGTIPQRAGVAKVAVELMNEDEYAAQCRELIKTFFNDPDKEVREKISLKIRNNFFDLPENVSLALQFVKSKAFTDNAFHFIYDLKEYKDSLLPCHTVILEICKEITTTLLEESKDYQSIRGFEIREIPPLLLRLYEQTQESMPDVANRCLDMWDELFEKSIGITRELTKSIEK